MRYKEARNCDRSAKAQIQAMNASGKVTQGSDFVGDFRVEESYEVRVTLPMDLSERSSKRRKKLWTSLKDFGISPVSAQHFPGSSEISLRILKENFHEIFQILKESRLPVRVGDLEREVILPTT